MVSIADQKGRVFARASPAGAAGRWSGARGTQRRGPKDLGEGTPAVVVHRDDLTILPTMKSSNRERKRKTMNDSGTTETLVIGVCRAAKAAAPPLRAPGRTRRTPPSGRWRKGCYPAPGSLKEENAKDVEGGKAAAFPRRLLDRLLLNDARNRQMADGIMEVAALPDPGRRDRADGPLQPNGLLFGRMRIPLGVIAIIYESRPNVTADAAALCVQVRQRRRAAGRLRGDPVERRHLEILRGSLAKAGLPVDARFLHPGDGPRGDRRDAAAGGKHRPRHPAGGRRAHPQRRGEVAHPGDQALQGGVPHLRGRERRHRSGRAGVRERQGAAPRVCNAMETLLVHESIAPAFLPRLAEAMVGAGVELRGCPETVRLVPGNRRRHGRGLGPGIPRPGPRGGGWSPRSTRRWSISAGTAPCTRRPS